MAVAQYGDPYRVCLRDCGFTNTQQHVAQGVEIVSIRSDLTDSGADGLLDASLDSYATARSAILQRRHVATLDQDAKAATVPPAGPADAAGARGADTGGGDAALNAAVADIKTQQAEQGGVTDTPAVPSSADPMTATPRAP